MVKVRASAAAALCLLSWTTDRVYNMTVRACVYIRTGVCACVRGRGCACGGVRVCAVVWVGEGVSLISPWLAVPVP